MSESKPAHIIVLGNEKGGTGKSTAAMHVVVNLLRTGHTVGTIDVDARQGTFSRYIENRLHTKNTKHADLPVSTHMAVMRSTLDGVQDAEKDEAARLQEAIDTLSTSCDFIVVDTPGSDTNLSRVAHSYADTLITPLNDSFIDLDMLVRLKGENLEILKPSTYAEMVWEQKKQKMIRKSGTMDWVIMRNRLSNINAKNKAHMGEVLGLLSKRIGFRIAEGFGERVIFRELFLSGLTLLDLEATNTSLTLSHVSARQELRHLMQTLQLPDVKQGAV